MNNILKNTLLTFLCCFGFIYPVVAQSVNPFDIVGRAKTIQPTPAITETDSNEVIINESSLAAPSEIIEDDGQINEEEIASNVPADSNNPFEIIRNTNVNISPTKDPVQKKKTVLKKENTNSGTRTNNLLFWLMTSVLIGLAFYVTIFRNYLTKIYRSFFNHNILRLSHREQRSAVDFPYLFLYTLYFMNISIFVFLALTKLYPQYISASPSVLFQIGGIVVAIYFLKHFVLNFLDYVFQIKPEMGLYNFTILVFNSILGIFLVPLNFAIPFASPGLDKSLIYIGLLVILAVFLFRSLRSLLLAMKLFSFHKFHFFIYLCAVEISPAIILMKYIFLQNGIQ